MGNDKKWKKFEGTGRIEDYLEYACTSEDASSESELDYVMDSTIGSDDISDITVSDAYIDDNINEGRYEAGWDDKIELY